MPISALLNVSVPGESVFSNGAHVNVYRQREAESGRPAQCRPDLSPSPTPSATHAAQPVKKHLDKFAGPMKGRVFDSVLDVCI
ncbi:MAG: hypothetical protein K2Y13_00070 [Burkholderiaceae bacterium]|nr:hypothetical protein [Burkholderiaceae bacterium]